MAPNGPKNGGSRGARGQPNTKNTRGGGGITKRRSGGATKIDRDGDLDMDAPAGGKGAGNRGGKGRNKNENTSAAPSEPNGRANRPSNSNRPNKPTSKAQQMIAKVINNGSGSLSSRISQGIDTSSRHNRPINGTNLMSLKVQGLQNSRARQNVGGGRQELIDFLQRKATAVGHLSRTAKIKKLEGDFVYITTNKEDGEAILKLDGVDFAGTQIYITEHDQSESRLSTEAQTIKEKLKSMLGRRYDTNAKLLDLSNLGTDPCAMEMGMFQETTPQKLFRALMVICDEQFKTPQAKREAIVSVGLAGNNIGDVGQVMPLAETFPDLVHLDLSNNVIKELRGLRKWQHRFRKVETILLNNNPIEGADPTYKTEITGWFPKLQNLSGIQVRTAAEVSAAELASKPRPIPQNGADFRDINRIGELFITEFIAGFDSDRASLATKYYDEQSTFSLSVNTQARHDPGTPVPPWSSYIRISRNHQKITTGASRWQRLFKGTGLIQSAWQNLPATQHPNLVAQFDKYIIDCHPINGLPDPSGQSPAGVDGMAMTVHGEFEDQDSATKATAKRSFSRSFILGPGAPGRNPIRVISDMLALKAYSAVPTATGALAAGALPAGAGPTPVAAPTPALSEEAQKQQIVMELCKQTGMTPEYSTMCLEVAGWVFDQALVTFNEKRGQLPAEAFASAPL